MKQNSKKDKVVNTEDDYNTNQKNETASAEITKKENNLRQSKLTFDDLKGKKVDGDPELESDQPTEQVH